MCCWHSVRQVALVACMWIHKWHLPFAPGLIGGTHSLRLHHQVARRIACICVDKWHDHPLESRSTGGTCCWHLGRQVARVACMWTQEWHVPFAPGLIGGTCSLRLHRQVARRISCICVGKWPDHPLESRSTGGTCFFHLGR
jgi:hypothetical protein